MRFEICTICARHLWNNLMFDYMIFAKTFLMTTVAVFLHNRVVIEKVALDVRQIVVTLLI